jgi:hydroxyacyl-ACP dehydratase HTD2-like protein with hotdog domain
MLPWQHPTFLVVISDKAAPRMPPVLHFAVADSPVDKSSKGPDDFQLPR